MAAPLTFGIESQGTSVRAMGDLAAAAERAGLDAAWAPELYDRSATISVAEMAHRTREQQVRLRRAGLEINCAPRRIASTGEVAELAADGGEQQAGSEGCENELHGRPPRVREDYNGRDRNAGNRE